MKTSSGASSPIAILFGCRELYAFQPANTAFMNRRHFLKAGATLGGGLALPHSVLAEPVYKPVRGNAEHIISIWLGGGMAQTDTFDPKQLGDPKTNKPGSYYPSIDTTIPGIRVCEHLSKVAPLMEDRKSVV